MNPTTVPIEQWPDRLERVIAERCKRLRRVYVLRETDSTQDAARRMNATTGDVFVAWRQTAGRGRLGRPWADTTDQGIAATFVVNGPDLAPAMLAIASAVGTAQAVESIVNRTVGIKWPNDIEMDGRKLAGILIEATGALALIGIGINVGQTAWPGDLVNRAVSMVQLGVQVDRLDVLAALLPAIDAAVGLTAEQLKHEFAKRDVLRGRKSTFRSGERVVDGAVIEVDPLHGMMIRTATGDEWLEAAHTTVVKIER